MKAKKSSAKYFQREAKETENDSKKAIGKQSKAKQAQNIPKIVNFTHINPEMETDIDKLLTKLEASFKQDKVAYAELRQKASLGNIFPESNLMSGSEFPRVLGEFYYCCCYDQILIKYYKGRKLVSV